jgi:hypothetical protein
VVKPPPADLLKRAGIESFHAFFFTPRFGSIRKRVLAAAKNRCAHCGAPAYRVHWLEYTLENLRGSDLRGIDAVCGKCLEAWRSEDSAISPGRVR